MARRFKNRYKVLVAPDAPDAPGAPVWYTATYVGYGAREGAFALAAELAEKHAPCTVTVAHYGPDDVPPERE